MFQLLRVFIPPQAFLIIQNTILVLVIVVHCMLMESVRLLETALISGTLHVNGVRPFARDCANKRYTTVRMHPFIRVNVLRRDDKYCSLTPTCSLCCMHVLHQYMCSLCCMHVLYQYMYMCSLCCMHACPVPVHVQFVLAAACPVPVHVQFVLAAACPVPVHVQFVLAAACPVPVHVRTYVHIPLIHSYTT